MRLFLCLFLLTIGTAAFAADLVEQLRKGNHAELERLGDRAGSSGLAASLVSEDRAQVLAALHASMGAKDSWALLGMLAQKAADPDRSVATVAAQVGVEIAHQVDGFTIERQEVPSSHLVVWQRAWLKVATQTERWVDIRIYALEAAEQLRSVIPKSKQPTIPWEQLMGDADAEMRAAAIAIAPRDPSIETHAVALLQNDDDPLVALSAAQWLCGPLGSSSSALTQSLDAPTLIRLQTLATDKSLEVGARADLAGCLLAEGSEESRRALAVLLQQSSPDLRRALVTLIQAP